MTVMQQKRGTLAEWTANPTIVLAEGEIGVEIDTHKAKVGDGTSAWSALPYVGSGGLPTGGTAGQIVAKVDGTDYNATWIDNYTTDLEVYVKNSTGVTLNKGQVVYISGATGANALIALSKADAESTSSKTLGFLKQTLTTGSSGYVIKSGIISGIDTSGTTEGQAVWLSPTTAGAWTTTKPTAPNHMVYLGIITRTSSTVGEINITVQNGYELEELHNVAIGTLAEKDLLVYENSTSLWKNKTFSTLDILTATSAASTYLTQTNAANTYLTQTNATNTYLTQANAASTYLTQTNAATSYQPKDADLTAIAAISATSGLLKKTAADTWTLDTNTYLTANQSISITGDASGSGTTAISLTLANSGVTASTYKSVTVDAKGRVTAGTNPTTLSGYGITDAINTSSTAQTKAGDFSIGGNLSVTGNITFGGTSTVLTATSLEITDPLIYLSSQQYTTDNVDIGIFGAYSPTGTGHVHTGLVRNSASKVWNLISGAAEPTGNSVSLTGVTYDILKVGSLQVTDASTTRTNLGLAIGTDVQGYNSALTSISSTQVSNWDTAYTDRNKWDGSTLSNSGTQATARTSLGLGTMAVETASNYLTTTNAGLTYAPLSGANFTGNINVNTSATSVDVKLLNSSGSGVRIYASETLSAGGSGFMLSPYAANVEKTSSQFYYSSVQDSWIFESALSALSTLSVSGHLTVASTKQSAIATSQTSTTTANTWGANKVVMTAGVASALAPTLRPDGSALQAGDIWISW